MEMMGLLLRIISITAGLIFFIFLFLLVFKDNRGKTIAYLLFAALTVGVSVWGEVQVTNLVSGNETASVDEVKQESVQEDANTNEEENIKEDGETNVSNQANEAVAQDDSEEEQVDAAESDPETVADDFNLTNILQEDFSGYASQGRFKPLEFGIGSSLQNIKQTYGPALESGDFQHVIDYFYYDDFTYFNYDERELYPDTKIDHEEVIGMMMKVNNGSKSNVLQTLGTPFLEYRDELETGYVLEYIFGDYLVLFRDLNYDEEVDELEIWNNYRETDVTYTGTSNTYDYQLNNDIVLHPDLLQYISNGELPYLDVSLSDPGTAWMERMGAPLEEFRLTSHQSGHFAMYEGCNCGLEMMGNEYEDRVTAILLPVQLTYQDLIDRFGEPQDAGDCDCGDRAGNYYYYITGDKYRLVFYSEKEDGNTIKYFEFY